MIKKIGVISMVFVLLIAIFSITVTSVYAKGRIRISSGSLTGSWFPLGVVAGEIFTKAGFDYENTPGGAESNVIAIQEGIADFGITMTSAIGMAMEGKGAYEYEMEDVVALNFLHPDPFQVAITKKSGIESIEDFRGKTIAGAVPGQLSNFVMKEVFKAYGIDPDEDMEIVVGSQTEGMSLVRDGHADGWVQLTAPYNPRLTDLMYSIDMKLLPVSEECIDKISNLNANRYIIEAGTYPGQDEDVETFETPVVFAVNRNMPDETAYELIKALVENIDIIQQQSTILSLLTPSKMADMGNTPVHPGAIKYYKEIGVWNK